MQILLFHDTQYSGVSWRRRRTHEYFSFRYFRSPFQGLRYFKGYWREVPLSAAAWCSSGPAAAAHRPLLLILRLDGHQCVGRPWGVVGRCRVCLVGASGAALTAPSWRQLSLEGSCALFIALLVLQFFFFSLKRSSMLRDCGKCGVCDRKKMSFSNIFLVHEVLQCLKSLRCCELNNYQSVSIEFCFFLSTRT